MPRFVYHLLFAALGFLPLLVATVLLRSDLASSSLWLVVSCMLLSLLIFLAGLYYRSRRHLFRMLTLTDSLEGRLQAFQVAVQQAPLSLLITDEHGNIQYSNPFMQQISGYSASELEGSPSRMLKSGHTAPETYQEMWNYLQQNKVWNGRFSSRSKTGQDYLEQVWMAPVLDHQGQQRQYIAIKVDITEQQLNMDHIQMHNQALELLTRNAPLADVLDKIFGSGLLEHSGLYPAAFLVSIDKHSLHLASAPSLPGLREKADIPVALQSAASRELASSYSQARFNPHPDLNNPFHQAAQQAGMQCCWSEPIQDSAGFLAGLLLFYRKDNCQPDAATLKLINSSTDMVRLALQRSQNLALLQLAETVYRNSNEALAVSGPDGVFITVNPAFTRITGFEANEIVGHTFVSLLAEYDGVFLRRIQERLDKRGRWKGEIWARRKNGEIYPQYVSVSNTYNADGSVRFRVSLFADISQQKANEEHVWRQANFDSLTGVANRRYFTERLQHAIRSAQRQQQRVGLLFIDLDHFKPINDQHGHSFGDQVLAEVAQRIQKPLRETDLCARLGGDEFVVVLEGNPVLADAQFIALRIQEQIALPFVFGEVQCNLSFSCGISFYPDNGDTADSLIRSADTAMYEAKRTGRSQVIVSA